MGVNKTSIEAIAHLRGILAMLGPCGPFDHHGYCQAHFIEFPCRVKQTREWLESLPKTEMPDPNTYEAVVQNTRWGVFVDVPRWWAGRRVRVTLMREEYECPGCGKRKPAADFPADPNIPGLCTECDGEMESEKK